MRTLTILLLFCLTLPVTAQTAARRSASSANDASDARAVYAVIEEVDRIAAARALWPNFDPRRIPVAIYDGQTTLLFRHPAPPEGFTSLSSRQGVWAFPGRHESITANAPVELNGVWTATAMLKPDDTRSLTGRAALVIHELFHAHQREHHPKWIANELELFIYPFDDAELLSLRRLETEALRRAAHARRRREAACWARAASDARRQRFARLTEGAAAYERALELHEGLARYVEARAAGARQTDLTVREYAAEELRLRGYATGHAHALLLERFAPAWTARLEAGETLSLDEMLAAALPTGAPPTQKCVLPASFAGAARRRAKAEVAEVLARRQQARRDFASQAGWKVVVNADAGAPLWPQGFDPLNVQRLGGQEVLHTRFLKLGNDAGAIEIFNQRSLTTGAGAHPLFNGVRQLTLAGIAREPLVRESDGKLTLDAASVKAEFRGARLERAGQSIIINLRKPEK